MRILLLPALLLSMSCRPDDAGDSADGGGDDGASDGEVTWYRDVKPIIDANCTTCHAGDQVAGFPLDSYDVAFPLREAIRAEVGNRTMPPFLAAPDCNEYKGDISLSEAERQAILDWVDEGAPEGNPADARQVEPITWGSLERVDFTLEMPVPYVPSVEGGSTDDYRCFQVDWPVDDEVFVTGYQFNPGNAESVHHVIAYIAPPGTQDMYQALDDAEAGDGWTCYGGPGAESQEDVEWLGGWAPGGPPSTMPTGSGIRMEAGASVVLQVHYNLAAGNLDADQSTMDIMVEETVDNPGVIQPWADPAWLNSQEMHIPANSEGVTHEFRYSLPLDLQLHSASLHMHTLGKSGRAYIDEQDGADDTCLLEIDRWDFSWQRPYGLVEPVTLHAGDELVVECTWDNPTDEDVYWGDNTGDEMCLGSFFLTY